jgi:hypothetical protein
MEKFDGKAFAEILFAEQWKLYLTELRIDLVPDEWFYRTITQAYEAFNDAEQHLLTAFLVKPEPGKAPFPICFIPRLYEILYDEIIEPYVLRKLSVYTSREIFENLLVKLRNREEVVASAVNDPSSIESDTIIDISAEGQVISYDNSLPDEEEAPETQDDFEENWKLGTRFKDQLGLQEKEVVWLNKFWDPSNSFLSVEVCCIETIKVYLACLKEVSNYFESRQLVLNDQISKFIDAVAVTHQVLVDKAASPVLFRRQIEGSIYLTLFKRAEMAVRAAYKHTRKINGAFTYNELSEDFERWLGNRANEIILAQKSHIMPPDRETEISLNEMSVTRWKLFFDEIEEVLNNENIEQCALRIDELAVLNAKNSTLENLYYEASKLFAKYDKLTAVRFYLKYLYTDINSDRIDNKQLGKSIQKRLFSTEEQLKDFEKIANELVKTNDLATALTSVAALYTQKRKKIQLDTASIEQIRSQHLDTLGKLNELLNDEEEELAINATDSLEMEEVKIQLTSPLTTGQTASTKSFTFGVDLNENQKGLLILFEENNFYLVPGVLNSYSKSRNLFKNQIIESINDCCYEELDDILIEESEDGYVINEFNYKKIINLC